MVLVHTAMIVCVLSKKLQLKCKRGAVSLHADENTCELVHR